VTLNSVVRSQDEKGVVEMKGAKTTGENKLTSDLKVAPSSK
jgi:hypothetical protein